MGSHQPRWSVEHVIYGGVCFAAGFGLWVGAEGFQDGLPGDRGPLVYGPAGISAAAI